MGFLFGGGGGSAPAYSQPVPAPTIASSPGMSQSSEAALMDERRRKRYMTLATTPGNAANYTANTLGGSSILGG